MRLGTKVTLIARSTILSKFDPEIGAGLEQIFKEEGMRVITQTIPSLVTHDGKAFKVQLNKETIVGDRLLIATGRQANTSKLNLEKINLITDVKGNIVVDSHMRTNVKNIYASGDCTTQPQYVYVAAPAGTRAAINMLGGDVPLDLSILPEVVFTEPQVATVGLTEVKAKSLNIKAESRTLPMKFVPRSLANFDTHGFIKLVAEKETGRLLGAQFLAAEAGETVQTITVAIKAKMTIHDLSNLVFPYLTMVEALKLCAQIFTTNVENLSCCADTGVLPPKKPEAVSLEDSQQTGFFRDRSNSCPSILPSFSFLKQQKQTERGKETCYEACKKSTSS